MAINLNGTTGITTTGLTSNGIDDNATSTAMTLDTSGNLLVGKTSLGASNEGAEMRPIGYIALARDGGATQTLNRLTSDGDIVQFQKDGANVGSIGSVDANSIRIGKGNGNLRFYDFGSGAIAAIPCSSSGANQSNVVDLGNSSSAFKDLYLSGGVFLGGTGSANKLSDYEEGTWTPTFAGLTIGNGTVSGTYTKIGRQVTVVFGFNCGSTTSVGTLGNITGLPFLSANIWTGYIKVHGVVFDSGSRWFETVAALGNNSNTIFVPSITNYNSAIDGSNPMTWVTNDNLVFTATYFTA